MRMTFKSRPALILCLIDSLLGNDCEISSYTTAVCKYCLSKQRPWLGHDHKSQARNKRRAVGSDILFVVRAEDV
jgi:hypothetical protein